jgi:outer membrane protein assembly factor BamB
MKLPLVAGLTCWAFITGFSGVEAWGNDRAVISDVQAKQAGLTVQWFTQLNTGTTKKLVNAEVIVNEDESTTYFELTGGGLREVFSDKDLDPTGAVMGVAGAEEFAKLRQEVMQAELKFLGSDASVKMERYSIPKITIFALTANGVVHSINGESGKVNWRTEIGTRRFPSVGLGASKKYVAAVNGSKVFCLDTATGKIVFEHQCTHAVLSAPAVSDETVFVPLADGSLQALPIETEAFGNLPLNAVGSATTPPIVAGNIVAWTSDAGYLTVAPKSEIKSMKYRIKGAGEFASSPASSQGRVFAVTINGFIYAIDDRTGSVLWNFAVGQQVSKAPVALGDSLLIISDENNLFNFDAQSGIATQGWEQPLPNISGFAGASQTHLYLKDIGGNIVVYDRKTGTRLQMVGTQTVFQSLVNTQTDRIYICTSTGMLECLREIGQIRPYFHADAVELAAADGTETVTPPADPAEGTKPATDSTNPFGGVAPPKKDASNPFGNSGGGGQADEDPFKKGGAGNDGANPFGNGSG